MHVERTRASITIRQEKCPDKQEANKNVCTLLETFYRENGNGCIERLSLARSNASGKAIFGDRQTQWLERLRADLQILDMSYSQASEISFLYLSQYPMLREVYFDHCSNMNLGAEIVPHNNIRKVSLLGSTVSFGAVVSIWRNFPKIQKLSFTLKLPESLRPKVHIPCGCFKVKNERAFCPHISSSEEVIELSVRIKKKYYKNRITVLDAQMRPLQEGKVTFKEGKFYAEPDPDCLRCDVSVARLGRFATEPTTEPEVNLHDWLENIITDQDTRIR